MDEPAKLITLARNLVGAHRKGAPNQTSLRRGISTAYYALFHALARAGADGLVGKTHRKKPRYALIYRAFEHGKMRQHCEAVDKAQLAAKAASALGAPAVSQDIRDIASAFVLLQQQRHWADYSPLGRVSREDAGDLVDQAETAIFKIKVCDANEIANFLAFLLVSPRE